MVIAARLTWFFFCFKQKTAYEMRISDWSSDVCSSDLLDRDRCLRDWRTRASLVDRHVQSLFFNMAKIAASGRLGLVGAVGIGARDEGMPLVRLLEQGHRAIAVLHIGRMDQYDKGATIGIDHCMAFASHGLLDCVVTTRSACFGGLNALAVDDGRGWCWFSPCPDAIDPNEMMIEAFAYPIVAQGAEPRSEERVVGKECVSTCRSRGSPDHTKKKKK